LGFFVETVCIAIGVLHVSKALRFRLSDLAVRCTFRKHCRRSGRQSGCIVASLPLIHTYVRFTRATACIEGLGPTG
jgi:hypothetical protein